MRATITLWLTGLLLMLIVALLLSGLTGCYSPAKARKAFGRAVITYPEIPADYCARTYPAVAKTDSSAYKGSIRAIDSLTAALQKDSVLGREERERLLVEIWRIRESIPAPANCDSLVDAVYRLAAKEMARGDRLQVAYNNLAAAVRDIKPIRDTIVNTAALDLCSIERGAAILAAHRTQAELDKWRKIAKKRFWMLLGAGFVITLGLFGFLRKKLTKPLN